MTATIRTVLDLPDLPTHEATLTLPPSQPQRQRKTFSALREGGKKDKQHSLGTHVYSERFPGGGYGLGVRWNAGLVRKNGTGFAGRVFFDSLSIAVGGDENLVLVPELRSGMRYDGPTATHYIAERGGHVFPPRAVLERRFILVPKTWSVVQIQALRDQVFGFKGTRFPQDEPWGPARERQPKVDRAHYASLFKNGAAQARQLLQSGQGGTVYLGPHGTWPVLALYKGALGPWIPDGDPQAGAPAGYKIDLQQGFPQCAEALEFAAMQHECSIARNPVAWFDLDTGEQLGCHDWQTSESGRPVLSNRGLIMPAFLDAQRKDYPNFNAGSSPYQGTVEAYASEDSEHSVRVATAAKHLAFSGGDMMAKDDLAMLFEHHRAMILNDRADAMNVSWPSYSSLTKDLAQLSANPHHGGRGLRQFGWTVDLGVCRSDTSFLRKAVEAYLLGVDSCGIFFREFHTPYIPAGQQGAQMFHEMIDKAAVLRAVRLLNDPILVDRVLDTINLWILKVLLNPNCRDAKWVYRTRLDGSEIDPIAAADHGVEYMAEHIWCVLGLAALCAIERGDKARAKRFLEAGLKVGVPHGNLAQRLAWIKAQPGDQSQFASFQAAIEALV